MLFARRKRKIIFDLLMFSRTEKIISTKSKAYDAVIAHSHSFAELAYVVSGKGTHQINDIKYELEAGDVFFIGDDSIHNIMPIQSDSMFEMINVIFDKSCFDDHIFHGNKTVSFGDNTEIKTYFCQIYNEYKKKSLYYDAVMKHLTALILYRIERCRNNICETEKNDFKRINIRKLEIEEIIEMVHQYIEIHYREDILVEDISKHIGIGVATIQRIFKNQKKTTVKKTIVHYRIKKACELLAYTDHSVQQIAENVGFNDLKNFYSAFKKSVDMTPAEFRDKNQKK